ncbi:MAG: TonB-dependent receptor plug domain-containing protein, partial [candidate division Zixibacteria bacterium]
MSLSKFALFSLVVIITVPVLADDSVDTMEVALPDEVIVTANRLPSLFPDLARSISIINRDQIRSMPARSVEQLLAFVPSVEIRHRSTDGVQADLCIRAGSFEQTLLLVDGIKMSDPQTGHHNLDLPIDMSEIARIEVLRGSASRLYGPNGMNGAINFITRSDARRAASLEFSAGEFGLVT